MNTNTAAEVKVATNEKPAEVKPMSIRMKSGIKVGGLKSSL